MKKRKLGDFWSNLISNYPDANHSAPVKRSDCVRTRFHVGKAEFFCVLKGMAAAAMLKPIGNVDIRFRGNQLAFTNRIGEIDMFRPVNFGKSLNISGRQPFQLHHITSLEESPRRRGQEYVL